MKKATITLTFEGPAAERLAELTKQVDLNTLLRDALGEYYKARKNVPAYIAKRGRLLTLSPSIRRFKIRDLTRRVNLALLVMSEGATIELSEEKPVIEYCVRHGYGTCTETPFGLMCDTCVKERK